MEKDSDLKNKIVILCILIPMHTQLACTRIFQLHAIQRGFHKNTQ